MPKISVVMPVYNTPVSFLQEAVDSILNQTYSGFEFLIIDDGSSGDCEEYLKSLQDKRIRIIRNAENIGITKSLNIGLREAKGKYIARMDADDISLPTRFEKQLAFMESHPEVILCGTNFSFDNRPEDAITEIPEDMESYRVKMLFVNPGPSHPTTFFDREKLNQFHIIYDEQLTYAQDYGLFAAISEYGPISILPEILVHRRKHEAQISKAHRESQIQCDKMTQKKLLSRLLGDVSDEELNLHYYCTSTPSVRPVMTPQIAQWYDRLIAANKIKGIYNQKKLKKKINTIKEKLVSRAVSEESGIADLVRMFFRYLPFFPAAKEAAYIIKSRSFIPNMEKKIRFYKIYLKGWAKAWLHVKRRKTKEDYPIDIVITWVDGSDAAWQAEKEKYSRMAGMEMTERENPAHRFREWGTLKYWFRAVEEYAPWVRKIYFVTCGQKPDWLNTENDKICFVSHRDFIPTEYLPTFCSDVIELNLWRIKGLSEHFIYFNDDVFLNRPVQPEDFFEGGLPKMTAVAKPLCFVESIKNYNHRLMNDCAVINSSFNIRKVIQRNPEKWFTPLIKDDKKFNRRIYEDGFITGMDYSHTVMPFLRQSFMDLWQEKFSVLDRTCRSKFRNQQDVTIHLPMLWSIFHGQFVPVNKYYHGVYIYISISTADRAALCLREQKSMTVCLNDSNHDSEIIKKKIIEAFEEKLPKKSSFER